MYGIHLQFLRAWGYHDHDEKSVCLPDGTTVTSRGRVGLVCASVLQSFSLSLRGQRVKRLEAIQRGERDQTAISIADLDSSVARKGK